MSSSPEFQYEPMPNPPIVNWPKAIMAGLGISALAIVFFVFVWNPLSAISGRTNDILNQSQDNGQGVAVGEPNPNGDNQTVPAGSGGKYNCDTDTYNCTDFQNQSEAQEAFDQCSSQGFGDIHQLKNSSSGIVCESLQ